MRGAATQTASFTTPFLFLAAITLFFMALGVPVALAFLAVGLWFGRQPWYRARIAMPASAVIACVGAYWFVERVFL